MGLRHGLDCLGCCWVLMLLAFVGGTMNLIWMGLATGLMTLEKLPRIGRPLTKPVGAMLIAGAAYVAWMGFAAVYGRGGW
jgi:predicted metal-binding membrane protein